MKMRFSIYWVVMLLAVAILPLSCSRIAEKEQPVKKEAPVTTPNPQVEVPAQALPPPALPPQEPARPAIEETTYPADQEFPIRLCTLLQDGESGSAGLVDRRSGRQIMARVGQTFFGYEVVKIDFQKEEAVVRKGGKDYTLAISESGYGDQPVVPEDQPVVPEDQPVAPEDQPVAPEDQPVAPEDQPVAPEDQPVAPEVPVPEPEVEGEQPPQLFPSEANPADIPPFDLNNMPPPETIEPTPEEIQAGIDPNNPATWPKTYRGPGIERAIHAQEEAVGK